MYDHKESGLPQFLVIVLAVVVTQAVLVTRSDKNLCGAEKNVKASPVSWDLGEHPRNKSQQSNSIHMILQHKYLMLLRLKATYASDKKVEKVMVFGTVNVGSLSGRSMELVDVMERRSIGNGYKLFYYGTNNRRNGVGIILDPEMKKNVLEVNRKLDRLMRVKIQVENRIINIVSAYAPQTGCEEEEKEEFWDNLGRVIQNVPPLEVLWVGGDLNGRVGEVNTGSGECMGRHGVGICNVDVDRIVGWVTAGGMALVNTYFMKLEQQKITYKSGNNNTQIDCIACRRQQLKDVFDCKVLPGENVHRPLICKIKIKTIKSIQQKGIRKMKWWKLKESECREKFV
ncbi:craniofacial development protein 2-like [Penaeus monodon]|uniref:craniofacial development protein 2-like n=1 Tax=Penaeus monodon TaxID=6687 RepID=UPI0018A7A250|nr:craniofacial development protein 2-like [Penaeus monodon]